jgi:hypothetical protein
LLAIKKYLQYTWKIAFPRRKYEDSASYQFSAKDFAYQKIKTLAYGHLAPKMYKFLSSALKSSPSDQMLDQLLSIWTLYITPWCYVNHQIKKEDGFRYENYNILEEEW